MQPDSDCIENERYLVAEEKLMRTISAAKFAVMSGLLIIPACMHRNSTDSYLRSDWQGPASADGSRKYAIDWSCEPKRYDISAETSSSEQEEYCEWHTITPPPNGTPAGKKVCMFTTSFDNTRPFYLNSTGQTPINSIGAAQALRDDCAKTALARRAAGQSVGHNCSAIQADNCVPERNSDPEICDKIRFTVGQQYDKNLNFQIDQMPPDSTEFSPMPLMRIGLLTGLPANCTYSQSDQTEVLCTIDASTTCFSVAGQLRPSIQVLTTPYQPSAVAATAQATPPHLYRHRNERYEPD